MTPEHVESGTSQNKEAHNQLCDKFFKKIFPYEIEKVYGKDFAEKYADPNDYLAHVISSTDGNRTAWNALVLDITSHCRSVRSMTKGTIQRKELASCKILEERVREVNKSLKVDTEVLMRGQK